MRYRRSRIETWRGPAMSAGAVFFLAASAVAAESGGIEQYAGTIGQSVAAILVFLVLLVVLGRWAWKPLIRQLQLREKQIADTIAGAEKREKEAMELLEQYRQRLAKAETDAQKVLEESRKQAVAAREQILEHARLEARESTAKAVEEIDSAKRDALGELYDLTAELATDVAARIIKRNLRPEDQRRLVEESLQDLRSRVAGQ